MPAVAHSGSLGLFLQVADPFEGSDFVSLVMQGVSGTGQFSGADLYTSGDFGYTISVPLSIDGGVVGYGIRNVNLFAGGSANTNEAAADLYLQNDQSGVALTAPLFIAGSGIGEGALPYEKGMFLFLRRPVSDVAYLYIQGPGAEASGQVALYVRGGVETSDVVELSVPDVVGAISGSARLYTHGF